MRYILRLFFVFLLVAIVSAAPMFAQHRLANITVGSLPEGIAVNQRTNLIYVSNASTSSDSVSVIDGNTNSLVTNIAVGREPWTIWVYAPAN